jgi:hypothetical protein
MLPPPRLPILGRRRRSMCLLPVFVWHQPRHRLVQWLLHVHEDVSLHACIIVLAIVGCPVHLPSLHPVLRPQPAAPAHGRSREPTDARQHGYGASRSCSWPFSVRAVEEDMVAPTTVRLSWWWGVQVWDIGQPRPIAWQQSAYATELLCRFAGPGLGRHSHPLALLGLTPRACASRFGAAPAGLLSPLACSLPIYLAVYYLCRLQMPRSSSCASPATNRYVRLFPSSPALQNLESGGDKGCGLVFVAYGTRAFIKILCKERR